MSGPNRAQRIAMLEEAIKIVIHHPPSIESYTKYFLPKFIRKMKARDKPVTVEDFFETIPAQNRNPRTEELLDSYWLDMFDRFTQELADLKNQTAVYHPTVAKADPPPLPPAPKTKAKRARAKKRK